MALRRTSITLGLEREVSNPEGPPERVRLSASFEVEDDGPTSEELRAALDRLRGQLEEIAGGRSGVRAGTRALDELVETYRPRQSELVELLQEDGEISLPEAALLHTYLAQLAVRAEPMAGLPPGVPPPTDRPIAAMPLENDRTPSTPRSIPQLLGQYRIETLKQAGAVRARRQISFEEYMALKRHFSAAPATPEGSSEPHAAGRG
ncbi:MAG: hypothetical protein L3K08_00555 [Thermoplasmata archaeon]|nr:hypothetical protein [Thermoplasmata archaeon]